MPDLLERLKSALGDRYGIEKEIGRGGMAVVFLAEDLKHRRSVALKVLHPELTATLGAERFLQEIEIVAGLQHPHILPLYDSGEAEGLLYYVMPYAEGGSLRQRLDREKQLAVDESVRITVEVADGLDYAHRKGVVHRDIKPGNILVAEGHATIADFGIARAVEAAQQERITSTGLGVGTPLYASPEQATAQETLDGRTDIYSLGCVLYEMLAGEPPLMGSTPDMIRARRLSETPTALHDLRDTVPPELDRIVARALARVPADRYATAAQFAEALAAVLREGPGPWASTSAMTPAAGVVPRRKRISGFGWVGVLTLVVAALFLIRNLYRTDHGAANRQPTIAREIELTGAANVRSAAISTDGQYVSVCEEIAGGDQLKMTIAPVESLSERRTVAVLEHCRHLAWAPDDSYVAVEGASLGRQGWFAVPFAGGTLRSLTCRPSDRSPDGVTCARVSGSTVYLVPSDRFVEDTVAVPVTGDFSQLWFIGWFPGGRTVLLAARGPAGETIFLQRDLQGDGQQELFREPARISAYSWATDRSAFYYFRESLAGTDLMRFGIARAGMHGTPEWLWSDSARVVAASSPSRDGRRMAITKSNTSWRIVRLTRGARSGLSVDHVTEWRPRHGAFDISKDGERIAYSSSAPDEVGLFVRRLEARDEERVVSAGSIGQVSWSPDGRFLMFSSPFKDTTSLWIVRAEARQSAARLATEFAMRPLPFRQMYWVKDRMVVRDTEARLMVLEDIRSFGIPLDSVSMSLRFGRFEFEAAARPLILQGKHLDSYSPHPSPDGQRILVREFGSWRLVSLTDTTSMRLERQVGNIETLGWSDDGQALLWWRDNSIYRSTLQGQEETLLMTIPDSLVEALPLGFGVEACRIRANEAGTQLYCPEVEYESRASLIENFDPYVN